MYVEDFLHGGFAVRGEKIDTFAHQTGRANSCGQSLSNPEDVTARFLRSYLLFD